MYLSFAFWSHWYKITHVATHESNYINCIADNIWSKIVLSFVYPGDITISVSPYVPSRNTYLYISCASATVHNIAVQHLAVARCLSFRMYHFEILIYIFLSVCLLKSCYSSQDSCWKMFAIEIGSHRKILSYVQVITVQLFPLPRFTKTSNNNCYNNFT